MRGALQSKIYLRRVSQTQASEARSGEAGKGLLRMDVSRWQTSLGTLGTSICHVGSSLANGLSSLAVDSTDREKVSFVTFSHLEYTSSKPNSSGLIRRPVLLIGYTTGFQVWDLGSGAPNVLVSRREGPVRYERHCPQSHPCTATCSKICAQRALVCFCLPRTPDIAHMQLLVEGMTGFGPQCQHPSNGLPGLVCLANETGQP